MAKAALELYSIRQLMEKDALKSLEQTKQAGYDGVEFAGFYNIEAEQFKGKLSELGLEVCGSHTGYDLINDDINAIFKYNKILGNKNIIIPYLAQEMRESAHDWVSRAKEFNEIGKKCADKGFQLAYHNHDFEFETFDGVTGYQILAENINPSFVKLQPDMGWVAYSGQNVEEFLEKYKDLIVTIHVKQFKKVGSKDAIEVHNGIVNYPPIITQCIDLGIEWFIIEQEGFDIPMLESIEINCKELKKMF